MKSNICFVSNVYPCKDDFTYDINFISMIIDFDKLNNFKKSRYSSGEPMFSALQMKIIDEGARCRYAKEDPCWGIVKKNGSNVWKNRCINVMCKGFHECRGVTNPFSEDEVAKFSVNHKQNEEYGEPKSLRVYYLINAIKGEGERSYFNSPDSNGKRYEILRLEKKEKLKKKIIGFRKQSFNDYCDEQYIPIYEDEDLIKNYKLSKYGSNAFDIARFLEKQERVKEENENELENTKFQTFESIDKHIKREVMEKSKESNVLKVNRFEFEQNLLKYSSKQIMDVLMEPVCFVFRNRVEMQYVAAVFLKKGIPFSLNKDEEDIVLANREDDFTSNYGCLYFEGVLKNKKLLSTSNGRGFLEGLSGISFVSVRAEDILLDSNISNTLYEIECFRYNENEKIEYIIKNMDGEFCGKLAKDFVRELEELSKSEYEFSLPTIISGLYIRKDGNGTVVYGIGHMEFDEY